MSRQSVEFLDLLTASPATVFNTGNLSTTALVFGAAASSGYTIVRLFEIYNKATAAYVAVLPTTAASPAFVASGPGVVAATEGINVPPGTFRQIRALSTVNLWFVASAASTPVQIVAYDKPLKA